MHNNNIFSGIKYACLVICLCWLITATNASPVDSIIAKNVGANFYSGNFNITAPELSLVYTEVSANGDAEYFIFNINHSKGFIIVSADDGAHPIIGYSAEGNFNLNNTSPEFNYWMRHYKKQIDIIRKNNSQASAEIQDEWNAYKNNQPLRIRKKPPGIAGPLLITTWAQSPYYNSDCPDNAVAGCTATAMGQIMKYWSYPPHGIGSHSYTDGPYGNLYANFDTTHYNWLEMSPNVTRPSPSVAELIYDCGVSVDMRYSPTSSGSFLISGDSSVSAQSAFVQVFGYSASSLQGLYRTNYSDSGWITMLENELNNSRPLLYGGQGDQGGHSWVCDGYDLSGNFHMNWGWGGYEDGYYNLNSLNPDNLPFNSDEEALIGLQPNTAVADFNTSAVVITAGDTVKFTDNSFGTAPITSWQWSLPGASSSSLTVANPTVIYNSPGSYSVSETVTNSKGSNTLTLTNYINVLADNTVSVYPTLSDGTFTIQLLNASIASSNLEFSVYDMLGQKIYTTTLVQYKTQVTIFVPHGMYFYKAFDASGKVVSKGKLMIE